METKHNIKSFFSFADWLEKPYIYHTYVRLTLDEKSNYESLTRMKMLERILKFYSEDPSIILAVCSQEEMDILKRIVEAKKIEVPFPLKGKQNEELIGLNHKLLVLENYDRKTKQDVYTIPIELEASIVSAISQIDRGKSKKRERIVSLILAMLQLYGMIEKEDLYGLLCSHVSSLSKEELEEIISHRILTKDYYILEIEFLDEVKTFITDEDIDMEYIEQSELIFEIPYNELSEMELLTLRKHRINMNDMVIASNMKVIANFFEEDAIEAIVDEILYCVNFDQNVEHLLAKFYDISQIMIWQKQKIDGMVFFQLVEAISTIVANTHSWKFRGYSLNEINEMVDMANEEYGKKIAVTEKKESTSRKDDIIKIDFSKPKE